MDLDLSRHIRKAPWIAEDIRSEAVLCELQGLSAEATSKRLWTLVFKERAIRYMPFNCDQVLAHKPVGRKSPPSTKHTPKQIARFERDVCIRICALSGVSQRTLARVHDLPHSRIAVICAGDPTRLSAAEGKPGEALT